MKLQTVRAIFWVAVGLFWSLMICDWVTPGRAPVGLDLIKDLSLYTLLGANCYLWGARRSNRTTITYEINAYEKRI